MDEADKLRSLKKAYAEIILNTAKAAASRIIVTERKALKLEQELFAAKEEALRTLLRTKQVMDAKITKAEIKSNSQQRLIDELEAQLHEAEDIIGDLRAELREVQDELQRMAVRHLSREEPILKVRRATDEKEYQENGLYASNSMICPAMDLEPEHVMTFDVRDSPLNPRNEINKCPIAKESHLKNQYVANPVRDSPLNPRNEISKCPIAKESHLKNQYVANPDSSALVMMNKDHDLSKNGCTQRIHAFERNSVDGKLSLSGEVGGAKSERIVREDAEGTDIKNCQTTLSSSETSSYPDNNNLPSEENCSKIIDIEDPKEADSHWASRNILHTTDISLRSRGVNGDLPLYDEVDGTMKEAIVREDEKGSQTKPVLGMDICCSLEDALDDVKQVKQNKEAKVKEPKRLVILSRNLDNQVVEMNQASHPSPCKSSSLPDPVSNYPLYIAEMNTKSWCVKANIHNTLINELESNKQEIESTESSLVSKMDLETVKEPLKSDLQTSHVTTNGTPGHPANDRLIKYTFQRKRKKESLSMIDESSSPEDSVLKKNKMEDCHASVYSHKCSSKSDSSRLSLRLTQVARQDEYFQVDNSAIKHDGLFVNSGKLERNYLMEAKKRRRKDMLNTSAESLDVHLPRKHVKVNKVAAGQSAPLTGNSTSDTSLCLAQKNKHHEDVKYANQLITSKKKSVDTKITSDYSIIIKSQNGEAPQVKAKDTEKQKVLKMTTGLSPAPHHKQFDKNHFSNTKSQLGKLWNSIEETNLSVRPREKNDTYGQPDSNLSRGKRSMQAGKVSNMHRKDGCSARPKGSNLEKAIKDFNLHTD